MNFDETLRATGLIAILRGLDPDRAVAVGECLVEAGFRIMEVPLNSPRPLTSISRLAERFAGQALIGAGTVLSPTDAGEVAEAGGRLVVAPNMDESVVAAAKRHGLLAVPGVATPTEAFRGLKAGADALKLFPAEAIAPEIVGAWRSVLPADFPLIAVGGITPEKMAAYRARGTAAFGIGSALFSPDCHLGDLKARADAFIAAWRSLPVRGS